MSNMAIVFIGVCVVVSVAMVCFTFLFYQAKKETVELERKQQTKQQKPKPQPKHEDEFTRGNAILNQLPGFVDMEFPASLSDYEKKAKEISKRFNEDLKHHNMCFTYLTKEERVTLTWMMLAVFYERQDILLTYRFKGSFSQEKLDRLPVPVCDVFDASGEFYSPRHGIVKHGRAVTD